MIKRGDSENDIRHLTIRGGMKTLIDDGLAKLGQTDVALTTYNFSMRSVDASANTNRNAPKTDMTAAIQAARKAGLGIVVMKVLAGGVSRVRRGDRLYGADPQGLSRQLGQEGPVTMSSRKTSAPWRNRTPRRTRSC